MKINMKNSEEKAISGGSATSIGGNSTNSVLNSNPRIRIAVFGQHEVGKSGETNFIFYKVIYKPVNMKK